MAPPGTALKWSNRMAALRNVFSVGHGNDRLEDFIKRLQKYDITLLFDVRRYPEIARLDYFRGQALADRMSGLGIRYAYGGKELGGFRKGGYFAHMKTDMFQRGFLRLQNTAKMEIVAYMCAEFDPLRCHRKFISDKLCAARFNVFHIMKDGSFLPHYDLMAGQNLELFEEF